MAEYGSRPVRCAVENYPNFISLLYFVVIILNQCYWSSLCLFEGFINIQPMKSIQKSLSVKLRNAIGSSNCLHSD